MSRRLAAFLVVIVMMPRCRYWGYIWHFADTNGKIMVWDGRVAMVERRHDTILSQRGHALSLGSGSEVKGAPLPLVVKYDIAWFCSHVVCPGGGGRDI